MKTRTTFLMVAMSGLLAISGVAQKPDAPGCKDPALFPTRMPKYRIAKCVMRPFDVVEFKTMKAPTKKVEGELTFVAYQVEKREDERSGFEVVRNYENAIKKIGGTIQGKDQDGRYWVNGTVVVDGKEVWAQAEYLNGTIWINTVKSVAMEQTIVANAESFSKDLKTGGHVTVAGIYFDTASATLKPASAPAIAEIAKLLKNDSTIRVYVVGHTDTVGNVDTNLKLSRDRAESVVQALVAQHGIAAARLRSFGNGPFAPVGSNATDDGRALNRRVELVMQ